MRLFKKVEDEYPELEWIGVRKKKERPVARPFDEDDFLIHRRKSSRVEDDEHGS